MRLHESHIGCLSLVDVVCAWCRLHESGRGGGCLSGFRLYESSRGSISPIMVRKIGCALANHFRGCLSLVDNA